MKNMNRVTMVIWGLIIFTLWGVILVIAYKEQDRTYINLTADLKDVAKRYINKKNIDLKINESYKVYINDLEEENYINSDENIEKYCIESIVITKDLFKYSYQINKDCNNKE